MARRLKVQQRRPNLGAKLSKEGREWARVHAAASKGRRGSRRKGYISPAEEAFYAPIPGPIPDVTPADIRPTPTPSAPAPKGPAYDWDAMFEDFTSSPGVPSTPAPVPPRGRRAVVVEDVEVFDEPVVKRAPKPEAPIAPAPAPRAPSRGAYSSCSFVVVLSEEARDRMMAAQAGEDSEDEADTDDFDAGDDTPDFDVMDGLGSTKKSTSRGARLRAERKAAEEAAEAARAARAGTGPRARAAAAERAGAAPTGSFEWDGEAHPTFALSPAGYNGALVLSSRHRAQVGLVCGQAAPVGLVDCGTGDCFPAGFALKSRREIPKGDYIPGVRGLGNASRERDREARVTDYVRQARTQARLGARAEAERLFGKAVAECKSKDAKFWICDRVREVEAQGGLYAAVSKKQGVSGTPKRRKKR